ncbi:hypothetical protein [Pseudidiomarina gelatinasegens]|uniref:hypothetical protein n=1 Tax=Pseudidiomarina gelatinasegens TaxID=2487740 RepID=UPI003A984962
MKADLEKQKIASNRGFLVLEWVIGLAVLASAAVAVSSLLVAAANLSEQQREKAFDRDLQRQNIRLERQLQQHQRFLQLH